MDSLRTSTRFICRTCRAQLERRRLPLIAQDRKLSTAPTASSSSSSSSSSTRESTAVKYAQLQSRRLIAIDGHDAAHFLQGLTTANIPTSGLLSSPSNPQALYSAFMNAQGRLLHDVFIYPLHPQHALRSLIYGGGTAVDSGNGSTDPAFLIEVDSDQLSKLLGFLKKYKLRAKVKLRALEPQEVGVHAIWGGNGRLEAAANAQMSGKQLLALDPRIPGSWCRLLAAPEQSQISEALPNVSGATEIDYTVQRYLQGVPEGQQELPREETLLHESNIDLMHGVDFRKGCYVGQELVIRTQHTGVVRKRILPIQLWSEEPGSDVQQQTEPAFDDGSMDQLGVAEGLRYPSPFHGLSGKNMKSQGSKRPDGKVIGVAGNIGLALCRLERVIEGSSGEGDSNQAQTKLLPLDLSSNERGSTEQTWLKPFIPSWWLERGKIMEGGFESLKVKAIGTGN